MEDVMEDVSEDGGRRTEDVVLIPKTLAKHSTFVWHQIQHVIKQRMHGQ